MIFLEFLTVFLLPPFFNSAIISIWIKNLLTGENIRFLTQIVCGSIVLIEKNACFTIQKRIQNLV